MKRKVLQFLIIFSIGIIVTYPAFAASHALDSYCTMYNGYNDTALLFLQNGRVFSALFFWIFGLVGLPFDSIGFISAFLTNLFLAIAILKLYTVIEKNLNLNSKLLKVFVLTSVFLLFYNPLLIEVLLLDESFVIALGILCMVLVATKIVEDGILNYVLAFILAIIGVACYQGIAAYLFVCLLLIMITKKIDSKEKVLSLGKMLGVAIIIYAMAFLVNFAIIKCVAAILSVSISKLGNFSILDNLIAVVTALLPNSLELLFGFINTKFYYFIVAILFVMFIYLLVKNEHKLINIFLLFILIISCVIAPFIPNLFMAADNNYIAARMALTLGILPSVLFLLIISTFNYNFKINYLFGAIITALLLLSCYAIHQNTMIDIKRYKEDVKYLNNIYQRIKWYENESGNKVDTVYYAKDSSVNYYYSFGHANGANIRLLAVDWAMNCAFHVYSDVDLAYKPMSKEKFNEYFKGKEYDKFDKKQLVFKGDKLYLLLY